MHRTAGAVIGVNGLVLLSSFLIVDISSDSYVPLPSWRGKDYFLQCAETEGEIAGVMRLEVGILG